LGEEEFDHLEDITKARVRIIHGHDFVCLCHCVCEREEGRRLREREGDEREEAPSRRGSSRGKTRDR
jgi:hypothetical protein